MQLFTQAMEPGGCSVFASNVPPVLVFVAIPLLFILSKWNGGIEGGWVACGKVSCSLEELRGRIKTRRRSDAGHR